MRVGIYAGTFDPITLGHLDIIRKALLIVDKLIIGVAENTSKTTTFSSSDREGFIRKSLTEIHGTIEVKVFRGLLVDFVRQEGSRIILRGLRAVSDFEYEFQISWLNHKLDDKITTVFLPSSNDTQFLSSTLVKQVALLGGELHHLLPHQIIEEIKYLISKN